MSIRRLASATIAVGALLGATLLMPTSASGAPPSTHVLGTYTCSDGRTLTFVGPDLPRFPTHTAFTGGKGVVGFWYADHETATMTVLDGAHAGEVKPITVDVSGPMNSHAASTPDLSRLATCSLTEAETETFVLDAQYTEYFGLDASYVGALVFYDGVFSQTVWLNAVQLSKR